MIRLLFLWTLSMIFNFSNCQVNPGDSAIIFNYWNLWNLNATGGCLMNYPSQPATQWCGIYWHSNGRVKAISMQQNWIQSGTLPSTIGNLSELQEIKIDNNPNLTGLIPLELGNLINLKRLYIDNCGFSGNLPSEMGNLSNLENLVVGNSNIIGMIPSSYQNLNKMDFFALRNSGIKGKLHEYFGTLDSLGVIWIINNPEFSSIIPDSLCLSTTIFVIDIRRNAFYGEIPPCLGTMPKLNTLNISHNNFTGPVPQSLFPPASYRMELTADSNHLTSLPFLPPEQPLPPPYYWQLTRIKDIRWNKLQFGDFENTYLNGCSYCIEGPIAPQDSVWSVLDTTVLINTTVTLNSTVTGLYNTYYWYKNGILIDSTTNGLLVIPNIQHSDSGIYTCNITNQYITPLPQYNLILNRHPITLHVTNSFSSNEILNTNLKPEVFPNPFDKELTVKLNSELNLPATLSLLNSSGKTVMRAHTSAGEYVFNTEKLPAGLYLIKVETERSMAMVKVNKE